MTGGHISINSLPTIAGSAYLCNQDISPGVKKNSMAPRNSNNLMGRHAAVHPGQLIENVTPRLKFVLAKETIENHWNLI